MTDSMNFGPEWLRNLSSEGSTGGGTSSGTRYQLAEYRYGREEMLALYEKGLRAPNSLCGFAPLYSEQALPPLALSPPSEDDRGWQTRSIPVIGNSVRGRGGSLERGGRINRGRGAYQPYGRNSSYETGGSWGNGEQPEWSPRKDYNSRSSSLVDNWRRNRGGEDDDGWRSNQSRGSGEKWTRSTSWRENDNNEERSGPPERGSRGWHDNPRNQMRRTWDEDHLPEWATENLAEGGGTFDSSGAFHGSDDEQQIEGKPPNRKEVMLQKSASQQNITNKAQPPPLSSSKSAMSLSKPKSEENRNEESGYKNDEESDKNPSNSVKIKENIEAEKQQVKKEEPPHVTETNKNSNSNKQQQGGTTNGFVQNMNNTPNRVEEDFDKLQEDLVLKLVVDEEPPKNTLSNFDLGGVQTATQPPPNLIPPPTQDKWFYQDPQGDMQGPFAPSEMAEWFRAGYFTNSLMVRRQCDDRFWMLGDLVTICGGGNPFQNNIRIPPAFKTDVPPIPEQDVLHYHQLLQAGLALRQAAPRTALNTETWGTLNALQQRELLSQQLMTHPQINSDLPYLQKPPATNPLLHMINQMQQTNKMPGAGLPDKLPNSLPTQLDPIQALVHQMGGLQSLQNRLPTPLQPTGLPVNLASGLGADNLAANLTGLQSATIPGSGLPLPNMPTGLGSGILPGTLPPRPATLNPVDSLSNNTENDPIKSLLRQLQSKQQHQQPTPQMDALWSQNQFNAQTNPPQWQKQSDIPKSAWDRTTSIVNPVSVPILNSNVQEQPKPMIPEPEEIKPKENKEQVKKDEAAQQANAAIIKEQKKKKEQEEKQAKKEAEEKRKQEQRKQESEKKAAEERRKKEEERVRKELEKAKKEAEDKRLRELEEKRRLKEQRKAEEEARKKAEEQKKLEEEERARREAKEREEQAKRQAELERQAKENSVRVSKVAPWSQSNALQGTSLAEIQKAEREKRAEQAALQQQQQQQQQRALQLQEQQQQQQQFNEKPNSLQLKWASKPIEVRKVKSLAEIQAEEQERLAKQAAEARLAAQKEKESAPAPVSGSIWSGQNLTWANTPSTQWSSNTSGGLWDEGTPQKSPSKPSTVFKSSSTSAVNTAGPKQVQKHNKSKTKKEEQQVLRVFNNNGPNTDEFTNWCVKALSNISTVDVPTFVSFLRDIESAYDVRDYCKEYLGDSAATQQFATQFLEKRRSYKPKVSAHQDDMCSPAPAITPSTNQHSTDFQEVKGKNKKGKKNKMQKVDSRILGFNVTAAQDRINVGARDYGDN